MNRNKKLCRNCRYFGWSYVIAILVLAQMVGAQNITGRISGTVMDTSKGVMPGVTVTVINEETNIAREVITDDRGFFVMTNLAVGAYSVSVEQPGFRKMKKTGFSLTADANLTADFILEPAGANSVVEIVAITGETVNTVSGEVGRVVDSQQVQNAALNGRNYLQLATLIPGAVVLDEDQLAQTTSLSLGGQTVNGNRPNTNYLAVDGGSNMDSGSNNSQINNVGIDFIRELSIKSSNFSAEFGRNSGSSVNVVTRSGEDKYHGGALWFLRNDKVDARNYFAPVKGALRFNDFGWNLGGPIQKKKLHFFAGQEWKRIRQMTSPVRRTIPTRAERAGDFTARSGNLRYPGTTTSIPGRNIASMITPDGRAIASVYTEMEKLASWYSDTTTSNNIIHQMSNPFNWRQDIFRGDYRIDEKHTLYFRYLHDNYDLVDPYGTFFSSNLPMTPTTRFRPGYNYQLSHTWIPGPRMVNEAKINSSWNGQRIPMYGDLWMRSKYGFQFPQLFQGGWYDANGVPNIDISGFANIRGPNQALMSPTTDIQILENFTYIHRRHAIKAGITFIRNRKDQNGRSEYAGYASFSTGGNTKTTGNAFADALLGNFRSYRESSADPIGFFRFSSWEGYVTDNWKLHRRLGIEIGVRWQRNLPTYTSANNITNFLPSLYNPTRAVTVNADGTIKPGSGDLYNGLVRAGTGIPEDQINRVPQANSPLLNIIPAGAPRGFYRPQLLWAPRFSFAYAPFNDNKTAVRGGLGFFYDKPEGNLIFPMVNQAPWLTSVNLENGNLSNPSGGTAAALAPMGNIDAIDPNLKTPYTISYSLGVQRELMRGMFLEVSYVANLGRHLIRQPDINQVPFEMLVELRKIPSAQRPSDNSMRPYKGYSSIRQRISDSTSNYHSLQTFFTKRMGKLTFTASYTWSKVLSDANSNTENPENPYDRKYSYGPASFDRSHVFSSSYSWQIPSRRFRNQTLRGMLMGWQLSGITRVQTGAPLTITASTSTGARRADYLGGEMLFPEESRGPDSWINPAAFAAAPDDRRGNAGIGIVRGQGLYLWDFSLRKSFNMGRFHEGMRLQFQADTFNTWNRGNFRSPVTRLDTAGFGTYSTAGPPRNIQMALRLTF